MFKKNNRYFADFRDADGKRLRKAFKTAAEARAYEAKEKAKAGAVKNRKALARSRRTSELSSTPSRAVSKSIRPRSVKPRKHLLRNVGASTLAR